MRLCGVITATIITRLRRERIGRRRETEERAVEMKFKIVDE